MRFLLGFLLCFPVYGQDIEWTHGPHPDNEQQISDLEAAVIALDARVDALENNTSQPPPPSQGDGELLYTDINRGPSNAWITVWMQGVTDANSLQCGGQLCQFHTTLRDDPLHPSFETMGQRQYVIVNGTDGPICLGTDCLPYTVTNGTTHEMDDSEPIDLSDVNDGDVVYLRGGDYDKDTYPQRPTLIRPKDGVQITAYPSEVPRMDCSEIPAVNTSGHSQGWKDFTFAKFHADCDNERGAFSISNEEKTNFRVVGNLCENARTGNSGACGQIQRTPAGFRYLGNVTRNTGLNDNNSHDVYHGGRGLNDDVEISYNRFEGHIGGRCLQFYGHYAGESLDGVTLDGNYFDNCSGASTFRISGSDAGNLDWTWVYNVLVTRNTFKDGGNIYLNQGDRYKETTLTDTATLKIRFEDNHIDVPWNYIGTHTMWLKNNCTQGIPIDTMRQPQDNEDGTQQTIIDEGGNTIC